ncbi:peroxisomal membrane protein pex16 [Pseudohyphozyma bogoriensis]|nr:peroxisomal membrane protein pex16 [Pseudohyphozyma bogoriensis]
MASSLGAVASSYEALILHNASRISSIESSLRSLTWFLPGRFQDSEVASEGLYSLLNVLGMYHDSVMLRTISELPPNLRPEPSSHARYTRHWTTASPSYKRLSRSLTILTYTELLIEMAVKKRKGQAAADKAVVVLEALKAALRLALLKTTGGRTSVQPPVPEREIDPSVLDLHRPHIVGSGPDTRISLNGDDAPLPPRSTADVLLTRDGERIAGLAGGARSETEEHQDYWKGSRTGYSRPTLASLRRDSQPAVPGYNATSSQESVKAFLMKRVLTVEHAKRPEDLIGRAKGLGKAAEIIWILRPLIYVLAMRKYGRRHTLPYLLSLALEYLAFSLRQSAAARLARNKASGPMLPSALSEAEADETKKRMRAFWWYLLRGPVWESWTKPQLEGVSSTFESKPLLGFVSTLISDYVPLINDYYFYTS